MRFEDSNGNVLGRIERTGKGNEARLVGEQPTRGHYQVVRYFTGEEQRGFVVPKQCPAPAPFTPPENVVKLF